MSSHTSMTASGSGTVKQVSTSLNDDIVRDLNAGDKVLISGIVYVARDAAHKRLVAALEAGAPLPFDLAGQIIYYMGPTPAPPGRPIGSAGPTTSYRMDAYTPPLLNAGLKGMIGKGDRTPEVREALQHYRCVYFGATGGVAALISRAIRDAQVIAFDDLGPEAVRRLQVVDFPAVVINDMYGRDAYEEGRKAYRSG